MMIPKALILTLLMIALISTVQCSDERGYVVSIGDSVPNFDLELANGASLTMRDLKGNVIMLQFTASWCSVCRREMPHIERDIWRPYEKFGLRVIGIDRDEPIETVKIFAKETRITYPLALDPGAEIFGLFAEKESGVTRNIIIDPQGKIIFLTRLFDPIEFENMIQIIHAELERSLIMQNEQLAHEISLMEAELSSEKDANTLLSNEIDRVLENKIKLENKLQNLRRIQTN